MRIVSEGRPRVLACAGSRFIGQRGLLQRSYCTEWSRQLCLPGLASCGLGFDHQHSSAMVIMHVIEGAQGNALAGRRKSKHQHGYNESECKSTADLRVQGTIMDTRRKARGKIMLTARLHTKSTTSRPNSPFPSDQPSWFAPLPPSAPSTIRQTTEAMNQDTF